MYININVFVLVDTVYFFLPRASSSLSRKSLIYMLQSLRGEKTLFF